ncbi:hypothetical protein K438DRAFT_1773979 [Mycena galopus ATCC 62051]|nr:hypothetical protein K438DRAFT_1773979 [Mycena galopus ATCC 62051]
MYATNVRIVLMMEILILVSITPSLISTERYRVLLGTNLSPLEAELPVFHAIISAAATYMACWDKDGDLRINLAIAEFEAFNRAMIILQPSWNPVFQHADLLSVYHNHRSVVSTIRRIPPEILVEIFCWTLPTSHHVPVNPSMESLPWVLTHVSQKWREIASTTPGLWSFITIDYIIIKDGLLPSFPQPMVETQVSRARRLNIHFQGSENLDPEPHITLFRNLANHSSLWEELTIALTTPLLPSVDRLQGDLPHLHRLCLLRHATNNPEPIVGFDTAPSLVEVDLFVYNTPTIIPTNNLTYYRMCTPWNMHWAVLKEAPTLQAAWIIVPSMEGPGPWADDENLVRITLPALTHLIVSHSQLLPYFITPKIETLVVQVLEQTSPWSDNCLESFSSHCHLKRFVVYGDATDTIASMALNQLPTLTEFGFMPSNIYTDDDPTMEDQPTEDILVVQTAEDLAEETRDEEDHTSEVDLHEDLDEVSEVTLEALACLCGSLDHQIQRTFFGAAGYSIDYTSLLDYIMVQRCQAKVLQGLVDGLAEVGDRDPSQFTFSTGSEECCVLIDDWKGKLKCIHSTQIVSEQHPRVSSVETTSPSGKSVVAGSQK